MMRSGKRSDPDPPWQGEEDQDIIPEFDVDAEDLDNGEEVADMGIVLDPLRRVSRSGGSRNKWGGIHMLRTGKRSGQAGDGQSWGMDFLRTLRGRTGLARRGGRRSWFGGGHMMRSGKRSSWGPCGPDGVDDEVDEQDLHPDHL